MTPMKRLLLWSLPVVLVGGLLLTTPGREVSRAEPAGKMPLAEPTLLLPKATPAKNPTTLSLVVDPQKVLGWISGTRDFTGRAVTIDVGDKAQSVMVQEGEHVHLALPRGRCHAGDVQD